MRAVNLCIIYMLKMTEVVLLFIMTIAILTGTLSLMSLPYESIKGTTVGDSYGALRMMLLGCFLLAVIHSLHNNFLSNLRLACREKSAHFACCWGAFNAMICKFGNGDEMNGLQYCCRDRILNGRTMLKQVVYIGVFLYVRYNLNSEMDAMVKIEEAKY